MNVLFSLLLGFFFFHIIDDLKKRCTLAEFFGYVKCTDKF